MPAALVLKTLAQKLSELHKFHSVVLTESRIAPSVSWAPKKPITERQFKKALKGILLQGAKHGSVSLSELELSNRELEARKGDEFPGYLFKFSVEKKHGGRRVREEKIWSLSVRPHALELRVHEPRQLTKDHAMIVLHFAKKLHRHL